MKKGKKLRYFAASFLMLLSTVTPLGGAIPSAYSADDLGEPVTSKTIESNGDGTYKITLSVTGRSSSSTDNKKANVVVVFDSSGSMRSTTSSYSYSAADRGNYRLSNGDYLLLYHKRSNGGCREMRANDNDATAYQDSNCQQTYTGTRYSRSETQSTRIQVAKDAVNALANQLLTYNTTTGVSDMVQMAFVDFASNVKTGTTHTTPTTNLNDFKGWVNATSANGGTNWEDALTTANRISFGDSDPVYIVFVSDGNPTFRNSRYNNNANDCYESHYEGWTQVCDLYGTGNSDPNGWNLGAAQNVATTIVGAGKTLYAIGTFGDADNMRNLNANAIYKDASDQDALEEAFSDIVQAITDSLSITNVVFEDGVTGMTEAAIDGKAGDFVYTRGGSVWADAPQATYDATTKKVKWDLKDTILSNGETATISFNVYPSQASLDLVADLNNGKVSYESLTDAQKAQIINNDGTFTLKTNTDYPTLNYKIVKTHKVNGETTTEYIDRPEIKITNPPAVALPTDKVTLEKIWEDSLDPSQREEICEKTVVDGETVTNCEVVMDFYKDNVKYNTEPIHLNKNTNWKLEDYISIAPGLLVEEGHDAYDDTHHQTITFNGKKYAILRTGHEYHFDEHDINSHYQLTNYRYHPMEIAQGDHTVLMNVKFIKDSAGNITGIESMTEMEQVSATNTIKGGINVQKKVFDENNVEVTDSKDPFQVKVTLKNANGSDYTKTDYRIYFGENNPCYSTKCEGVSDDDFAQHRTGHIKPGTGVVEETLYEGDTIRFVNVETGVLYATEENNIPKGYSLIGTDHTIKYGKNGEEKADTVAKTDGGLNYYAVAGNSASTAVIKNRYVSGNLEISKTVAVNSGNANAAQQKEFRFKIRIYTDATKATELTTPYKIDGKDQTLKSGDTFTLKHNESIKLLKLPEGAYYEIEEEGVFIGGEFKEFTSEKNYGFASRTATGDTGTIVKNDTKSAAFTNTYSVSGEVEIKAKKDFNNWRSGDIFTFNLSGDGLTKPLSDTVESADDVARFNVPINDIGTFNYTISEEELTSSNSRGGITNESGDVAVTVIATDNGDGTLSTTTYYEDEEVDNGVIVNRYSATGKIELGASKILTGRDWKEGELYTFTLFDAEGNKIGSREDVGSDGYYSFEQITYTFDGSEESKTFIYVIHEDDTNLPGGITSSGDITATVTVTDMHDGTLKTEVVYKNAKGEEINTIVNTYSAEGEFAFEASKELVGREWKDGESFTFALKDKDGDVLDTQTVDKDHLDVTFKTLQFTQADAGEHTYTIVETGTMPSGVTNSGAITATLTVTDDTEGNLSFSANYSNGGKIVNTYEANGEVELEATKVLEGRVWQEGESFDFELSGGNLQQAETVPVTEANPTAKFKKIVYSEADAGKTYTYTIKETTNLEGMSIVSSGDITVTVKLTDDGNGNIVPQVSYSKEDKIIKNTYSAEGSVVLEAEKKLEGREWKEGESFTFALKDAEGKTLQEKEVTKDNLKAVFDEIEYTKVGTYNYTIEETTTMTAGMSNSGKIEVTVEVTDNFDGTLTATPSYKNDNKLITNTYKASGEVELEATKELVGRDWKDGESFTFELFKGEESLGQKTVTKANPKAVFDVIKYTEADIDAEYEYTIKEVGTMPNNVTSSGDLTVYVNVIDNSDGTLTAETDYVKGQKIVNTYEASGKAQLEATKELVGRDWLDGESFTFELFKGEESLGEKTVTKDNPKAVFDEIQYTEADAGKTYTYTIKETTSLEGKSMTSSGDITATVKITDDGEGNLETEVTYTNNDKITNTYTAKGSVKLEATKELVGRDWLDGESYEFVLKEGNSEIDRQTVNKDNEEVSFKEIKYTEADMKDQPYTYTISEEGTLKPGLSKSGDITVTVTLTDDGKGNITAEAEYTNDGVITNTYKAKGQINLEIEKELVGRDWQDGEEYTFALKEDEAIYDRQTIDHDGKVSFEKALEYTEADAGETYHYTIEEVSELPSGISNSGIVGVDVTIEDNGDGTLKVTAEYSNDGKIVNTYKAEGKIQLEATKELVGRDWLDGESFTFELFKGEESLGEKTVTKDSLKAVFDEIKYSEADAGKTYTYTIKETTNLEGKSITKSGDITATVKITDNGDGTLKAEATYTNDGKITNTYTAEGSVELQATKELVGRDWLEGESYDFVLKKDGETIDTQTVDEDETVTFKKINYTEADAGKTYTYTISEEGSMPGVTKSDDITVTVKLTDDGKGKINAEVSYTSEGKIINTYKTKPVTVKVPFTVKKVVDDQSNSGENANATFKFELLDDKGQLVQSKEVTTQDLKGSVAFDAMTFDKEGTYEYTLVESNDGQAGFEYDATEHKVVIKVTDEPENAQLVAKVTIDGKDVGEVEFDNTYKAKPTDVSIDIEKILTGVDQEKAKEFEFILSDEDKNEIQTVTIKGSGTASFDAIKFEKVGSYTYYVTEKAGNAKGYTYDDSEYTVKIEVTDNKAQLEATVSYEKDGEEAEAIVFENSYKPEDVIYGCPECKVPIAAKKVLEKRNLKDNEFKFNVYLDGDLIATGHNLANGKIVLDNGITLDAVGTYEFTIKEDTSNRQKDITYDEKEYSFTVVVEDDGEGELKVVSDTSGNVTFKNKYNEPGRGNTPKVPYTYDGVLTSVATLAISIIGLLGGALGIKRSLTKKEQ